MKRRQFISLIGGAAAAWPLAAHAQQPVRVRRNRHALETLETLENYPRGNRDFRAGIDLVA